MKNINIAVNICTYHRNDFVEHNISKLLQSKFFDLIIMANCIFS